MEKNNLLTALSAVLIYLLVQKLYHFLTTLIIWVNLKLQLNNDIISIVSISFSAILSVLLLIFLYKVMIDSKIPARKDLFLLIGLNILLHGIQLLIHYQYQGFLQNVDSDLIDHNRFFFIYEWTEIIEMYFPFIALLYFLWKLKIFKKTVANTV